MIPPLVKINLGTGQAQGRPTPVHLWDETGEVRLLSP